MKNLSLNEVCRYFLIFEYPKVFSKRVDYLLRNVAYVKPNLRKCVSSTKSQQPADFSMGSYGNVLFIPEYRCPGVHCSELGIRVGCDIFNKGRHNVKKREKEK